MARVTRAPGFLILPAWDERHRCPEEDVAEGLEGPHVVGGPGEDEADGLDTGSWAWPVEGGHSQGGFRPDLGAFCLG